MKNKAEPKGKSVRAHHWTQARAEISNTLEQLTDVTFQNVGRNKSLELTSHASDVVYYVQGGWLIVSKSTEDGQRQIIDFVLPGEVFNPASADSQLSSTDLSALTRSSILVVPQKSWAQLLQSHPGLQGVLKRHEAASYSRIAERLLRVGKAPAETRIAYAICELCLRSTELGPIDGNEFHLPLTQQVLGDFVGLSSVHVSRTLRRLRRQNVLETGVQMDIGIKDVARLAEIAEVDLDDLRAEIIPEV